MKYVTATDSACVDELLILLRSARCQPGLDMSNFVVYQLIDDEFDINHQKILAEFPDLDLRSVDLNAKEFDFIRPCYHNGLPALFFDYLRAHISTECAPLLWLDTDAIIQNNLVELQTLLIQQDPEIAMAPDFRPDAESMDDFHYRMFSFYLKMFDQAYGASASLKVDQCEKYNCGVLYIKQSVAEQWRELYMSLSDLLPDYKNSIDPPQPYAGGAENTFGQGVWNLLFWQQNGLVLDQKWNNLKFANPDIDGCINHYAVDKQRHSDDAASSKLTAA